MKHFRNDGFGWFCLECDRVSAPSDDSHHSRLFREGEAESKQPRLSTEALAKWKTLERDTLVCPKCGATESLE